MADYDPTPSVEDFYRTGMGGLSQALGAMPEAQKRARDMEGNALSGGLSALKNWDSDHANVALLQGAGGMLAPTKTGSFSESLGNAFSQGASGLKWQQQQEMDRLEKMQRLQLAQAQLARAAYQDPLEVAKTAFGGMDTARGARNTMADFKLYQNPLFQSSAAQRTSAAEPDPAAPPAPAVADTNDGFVKPDQVGSVTAPSSADRAAVAAADPASTVDMGAGQQTAQADTPAPNAIETAGRTAPAVPQIQTGRSVTAPGAGMAGILDRDQQILQAYRANPGQFSGPDGQKVVQDAVKRIQESAPYKAWVKGSEVSAEETARDPHTLIEEQTDDGRTVRRSRAQVLADENQAPAGQAGSSVGGTAKISKYTEDRLGGNAKTEQELYDTYKPLAVSEQRLGDMSKIVEKLQTGKWAEQKADLVASARALGLPIRDTDTANPAKFQEFMKNATQEVMNQVKQMGGRPLVAEIASFERALASPGLQPEAVGHVLSSMTGLVKWQKQYIEDYKDWRAGAGKNDPNPENFQIAWTKAHPLQGAVDASSKDIAAKGDPSVKLPPRDKLETGKKYQTPKGALYWDGKRGVFTDSKPE